MMSINVDRSPWKRMRFGDVVRQIKATVEPETSGLERYVAGDHMDSDELLITRWGYVGDGYLGPAFHRPFKAGQVLYGSRRTYLRKVAYADFDGICANTTFVAESSDPTVLLPELLPFLMTTEAFHAHSIAQSKGSVNPYINWSDLAWYEFDLPPLDDQKRISDLLWASEHHLRSGARVLTRLDEAIENYCFDLYRSASEAGSLREMPTVADIGMGRQKAPKYMMGESPRPYLSVANVGHLELKLSRVDEMDFSDREFEKFRLRRGDILLTEGDLVSPLNVGRPVLYGGQVDGCCYQNTLLRVRLRSGIRPTYALGVFEGMRLSGVFAAAASTTTVTHLGLKRFSSLRFPVVSNDEQESAERGLVELLTARNAARKEREKSLTVAACLRETVI